MILTSLRSGDATKENIEGKLFLRFKDDNLETGVRYLYLVMVTIATKQDFIFSSPPLQTLRFNRIWFPH